MWLLVSIPMLLVLITLISGYLRKDKIYEEGRKEINIRAIIPKRPKDIVFLVMAFTFGIIVFAMQYNYFGEYIKASKLTFLIMLLAPIAYVDFKTKKIPDQLILTGLFVRLLFYIVEMVVSKENILNIFISDIKGLLLVCGIFLLAMLIIKNGIGMGDVKMYVIIAIYTGYSRTIFSLIISLLLCSMASIILLATRKKTRQDTIPLAPFVYIGTFIAILLQTH